MGKSLEDSNLKDLFNIKESDLKKKIIDKFNESRNNRTKLLGEKQSKEVDFHSLIGNVGGYVGLFLGNKTFLQQISKYIPNLFKGRL